MTSSNRTKATLKMSSFLAKQNNVVFYCRTAFGKYIGYGIIRYYRVTTIAFPNATNMYGKATEKE